MIIFDRILRFLTELIRWVSVIIILAMLILWWEGAFTEGCMKLAWKII